MTNLIKLPFAAKQIEVTTTSPAEWLSRFNLDWSVEKRPLYVMGNDGQAKDAGKKAIVRVDTDEVLNIVTDRYEPAQNSRFFDLLAEAEHTGVLKNLRGGVFSGGGKTWVQADFGGSVDVGGGDEVRSKILMANSHDGSFSFKSTLTPIRVICQNTLSAAIKGENTMSFRHTNSIKSNLDMLKQTLDAAAFNFEKVSALYGELVKTQVTAATLENYLKTVLQIGEEMTESESQKMTRLIRLFESGIGQNLNSGSLWSAMNAVTEFTSHELHKDSGKRQEKLFFGEGAELNKRALLVAASLVA